MRSSRYTATAIHALVLAGAILFSAVALADSETTRSSIPSVAMPASEKLVLDPDGAEILARALVAEMREELGGVEEEIRNHPYLEALERGEPSIENLRAFAGEQYNIIRSDLRSDALLVSRFGANPAARGYFQGLVAGEIIALDLLLDFAAALGLEEKDLEVYEPRSLAQVYPAYVATLAAYGSEADVGAAFHVNFAVFGEMTGRMSAALRSQYGLQPEDVAFFDFFATPVPGFDEAGVAVIAEGLLHGAHPRQIKRAARLLQAYELLFWNAVAEEP